MIKIHPDQGAVYFFPKGESFKIGDSYSGVLSWTAVGSVLIISKLKAEGMTDEHYAEMVRQFKALGYTWAMAHCPTGYVPPGFVKNKYGLYEMEL